MKTYQGVRGDQTIVVVFNDDEQDNKVYTGASESPLPPILVIMRRRHGHILDPGPSIELWNHSPSGFNWGYGGSGAAQLALAILFDVTGDKDLSISLHQHFKWEYVSKWKGDWTIKEDEIKAWIRDIIPVESRNGENE